MSLHGLPHSAGIEIWSGPAASKRREAGGYLQVISSFLHPYRSSARRPTVRQGRAACGGAVAAACAELHDLEDGSLGQAKPGSCNDGYVKV